MKLDKESKNTLTAFLLILLGFTFTSAGYISWIYNLISHVSSTTADFAGEVTGYLFQASGIALFEYYIKNGYTRKLKELMYGVYAADLFCIILCILGDNAYGLMVIGMIMNLLHGVIAGHYLYYLGLKAEKDRTALIFGAAYGLSNIFTWLISNFQTACLNDIQIMSVYILMTIAGILLLHYSDELGGYSRTKKAVDDMYIGICVLIFMLSLVKNVGFSFSTADISHQVNIESSRIYYMLGLIIAGFINNRNRRLGSVMCLLSLIIPFISLIMLKAGIGIAVIWALNYVFYGFYTVYRVIVMIDYALNSRQYHLLPSGLLFGRIGDALGTTACIALKNNYVYQTMISAVLYGITVLIFFRIYNHLYAHPEKRDERDLLEEFIRAHDLSDREAEVMELLLQNLDNIEISERLFVSASTVKFHIHNILKKTSCRNRKQLLESYKEFVNR